MAHLLPLAACAFLCLAGCAHTTPVAKTSPPVASDLHGIVLSDDIRKICKIEDTERTPRFDFDSANLSGTDREVLLQVAHCLTSGPLRGHGVELVGRADPRGELEYNMTLGTSRAAEVNKYLTTLGVNPLQLTTTSRGELDATGTDEAGWQRDRRVDMHLSAPVSVSALTSNE